MKTYPNVQEAFEHGTGDSIYTKGGQFIAISRNATTSVFNLLVDGFKLVPYGTYKPEELAGLVSVPGPQFDINNPSKNMVRSVDSCDSYRCESPDAFNQNL